MNTKQESLLQKVGNSETFWSKVTFTCCQRSLSRDDALKEHQMLKKRRELLDGGVPKEKLKIRNLELYNDGVKVQMDVQNAH